MSCRLLLCRVASRGVLPRERFSPVALASFRCVAEFGRLPAHIGHRVAIKLDLWVRAPARGSQDRARPSPASDRYDGCYVGGVCGLNASIMVRAGISSYSVPPPTRNIYLLISIAYHRRYGRAVWIDPVVLRAITISWNNIVIPVRNCPIHGHPDGRPLPWFTNNLGLRMRCDTERPQVTQDQGRSQRYGHILMPRPPCHRGKLTSTCS